MRIPYIYTRPQHNTASCAAVTIIIFRIRVSVMRTYSEEAAAAACTGLEARLDVWKTSENIVEHSRQIKCAREPHRPGSEELRRRTADPANKRSSYRFALTRPAPSNGSNAKRAGQNWCEYICSSK